MARLQATRLAGMLLVAVAGCALAVTARGDNGEAVVTTPVAQHLGGREAGVQLARRPAESEVFISANQVASDGPGGPRVLPTPLEAEPKEKEVLVSVRIGSCGNETPALQTVAVIEQSKLIGCGSSSESTDTSGRLPDPGPAPILKPLTKESIASGAVDLIPVHWRLNGPPKGRQVPIYAGRGYCVGDAVPEFQDVRVSERGNEVFITAYVNKPVPSELEVCRGIGGLQRGIVQLRQSVDGASLYDASTSPPSKRRPSGG